MTTQLMVMELPVDLIDRNPNQPRTMFDEVKLVELAESISAHGVIQPVEVEATADGRYLLHHGERRLRASRLAGRATIPAVVAPAQDDEQALIRGLLENLHREDLNPIDEANVFQTMTAMGWTRTRIARETGRAQAIIAGRLAWLKLEAEIQRLVALGQLPRDGRLADKLRLLPPAARVPLAEKLAARALSLKACLAAVDRTVEKLARREEAQAAGKARQPAGPGHPVPMVRLAAPGVPANANGRAPVVSHATMDAAAAMCRACSWRPKGERVPSWEAAEAAAAATCAECQKRDGPALPEVCKVCPGVALFRALLEGGSDHDG